MSILFKNGTIVTMSPNRDIIWDGSLYVEEDRITEVGKTEDLVPRYEACADRVVDAGRRVLFPGFVNIHCHSTLLACRGRAEDASNWDAIWGIMGSIHGAMTPQDAYLASMLAYVEMLKSGITTVVDSGGHMLTVGEAAVDSGIRAFLHQAFRDADPVKIRDQGVYEYIPSLGDRGLQRAVEVVEKFRGRDGGRIQCLIGPHATDTCSPDLLVKARREADRLGVGVTIHLAQNDVEPRQCRDAWGDSPCRMMEKAGFLGPDFIGAHSIFLNDEDIAVLARNHCSVSHNPQINAKRAHIAPVADMMEGGINVGLGSDNMFYDIVEVMKAAQMVWRLRVKDPTQPTPETVLEMASINGARAVGMQGQIGSLEAGKLADIVMINYNRPRYTPLVQENVISNLVHFGASSDVEMTVVGGRILVDNFRYVGGDEQEVLDSAQRSGEEVWARARADWMRRMDKGRP